MKRHRRIGHDRFRSRSRDLKETPGFFHNLIPNEIQIPFLRFANHLLVGDGSFAPQDPN